MKNRNYAFGMRVSGKKNYAATTAMTTMPIESIHVCSTMFTVISKVYLCRLQNRKFERKNSLEILMHSMQQLPCLGQRDRDKSIPRTHETSSVCIGPTLFLHSNIKINAIIGLLTLANRFSNGEYGQATINKQHWQ